MDDELHEVLNREWQERLALYEQMGREAQAGRGAPAPCSLSSTPERLSDALAVHPRQVKAAEADAKARGVPTEFAEDGRMIVQSRAHQKRYLRAYKLKNKDASYGD